MKSSRNKHGFKGVRKRRDGRAKPYYARLRTECVTVDSAHYVTPYEAGAAYDGMRLMIVGSRIRPVDSADSIEAAE